MQFVRRASSLVLLVILIASLSYGQVPKTMSYQGILTDGTGKIVSDGAYNLTFSLYDVITGGTALWTETQSAIVSKGVFSVILGSSTAINLAFDKPYFLGMSVNAASELVPRMQLTSSAYALNAGKVKGTSNVIPADGSVGIGTTTPMGNLEVKDGLVLSGSGTEGGQITLLDGDRQGGWEIDNAGAMGSEMLRIYRDRGFNNISNEFNLKNNGNVGIGVGDPQQKLDVNGMIKTSAGVMFPDGTTQTTAAAAVVKSVNGLKDDVTIASGANVSIAASGNILTISSSGSGGFGLPYSGVASTSGTGFSVTNTSDLISVGVTKNAGSFVATGTGGIGVVGKGYVGGISGEGTNQAGQNYGVYGKSSSPAGVGVSGEATSQTGQTYGVYGKSGSTEGVGVMGQSTATTGYSFGGDFRSFSLDGTGVYGRAEATTGTNHGGFFTSQSSDGGEGVHGLAASSTGTTFGGYFESWSPSGYGVYAYAPGNGVGVLCEGSFEMHGVKFTASPTTTSWSTNKPATVKLNDGTKVKLFTEEAAELYFTDYGQGRLNNGRTHIELDPAFLQTVTIDAAHTIKVFAQLEDDCRGVYIANKSRTGFDVVELQGGTSNASFSYRVVCKRKYYEDERLATEDEDIRYNTRMLQQAWPEVLALREAARARMQIGQAEHLKRAGNQKAGKSVGAKTMIPTK